MNDQDRRQIIAHAAMGLAACVGAYMALVDGPRKALVTARAEAQSLSEQVRTAEGLRDQIPAMTAALQKASHDAAQIGDMGRLAREERSLFAAMMALSGRHHVRLDELNPGKVGASRDGSLIPAGPTPQAPRADATVAYTMVAIAAYDDLTAFTAALRNELGYAVIRSIRMTPVQDDRARLVRAFIETEHY